MTITPPAAMLRLTATLDQLGTAAPTPSSPASVSSFASLIAALSATQQTAGTTTTTAASADVVTGEDILAEVQSYEGTPYVFGGESRDGIDCSGLVQASLDKLGITVGRNVGDQMEAGTEVASLDDAMPGDLIVLDGGAHIVVYAGNGQVTHAPFEGRTVTTQDIWFDESDIATIRRVAPATAPAATTTSSAFSTSLDSLQAIINAQAQLLARSSSL